MRVEIFPDADAAAEHTAQFMAQAARAAIAARGRFVCAVSGGTEPWIAFRRLATQDLDWRSIFIAQVDERIAPAGSDERNLTHLRESLVERVSLPMENLLAMPVEDADPRLAAVRHAKALARVAGDPVVFDLVHLGLGTDGHTASLVPGDAALDITEGDVSITGEYRGRARMTLTFPAINRARALLWLVPGERKQAMIARLLDGDGSIPAGRVRSEDAIVIADRAAAAGLYR
jgi:6-phosphogluconolactonase